MSSTVRADGGQATVTWPGAQDSTVWGLMRAGDPEQSPAPGPGSAFPAGTRSHFLAFPAHQGSCQVRHANMLRQHPEVQLSQFPPGSGTQLLEHNKPQQLQSIFLKLAPAPHPGPAPGTRDRAQGCPTQHMWPLVLRVAPSHLGQVAFTHQRDAGHPLQAKICCSSAFSSLLDIKQIKAF